MRQVIFLAAVFMSLGVLAQQKDKGDKTWSGGVISLGARSTGSFFNDEGSGNGFGMGGQFRIQFGNNINSDWFFDYITSPVGDYANRTDYHIGWSVLVYPFAHKKEHPALFKPYVLAGHCFDYTNIRENKNTLNYGERWSSAVQTGIGTHVNITNRLDVTLQTQYMIHLGNDVHAEARDDGAVLIQKEKGKSLEGHVLMTLSMNYKIADLW